jgi:hypothetical protein
MIEQFYCVVTGKPGSMSVSHAMTKPNAEQTKDTLIKHGLLDARIVTREEGREFKRLSFSRHGSDYSRRFL